MVEPPAYGGCTDKTVVIHGSKVASGDGVRSVGRLLASEAADAHGGGRSWVSKVFSVDRYGCAASLARKFGRDGRYTGYESLAACTIETELGGVIIRRPRIGADVNRVVSRAARVPFDACLYRCGVQCAGAGSTVGVRSDLHGLEV